jgi:tRNA(fMet)-specific endonuclease VapC
MRYMLDTNICIYLLAGGWRDLEQRFSQLTQGDALVSAIVLAELRAGIEKSASRWSDERAIDALTAEIRVMPFDEAAASSYGVLRAQVPSRQRNSLDRLIAAHALSLDATLVTSNEADFAVYPGLQVENWTK